MLSTHVLATCFLHFGTALADLELRIALANHVNSAAPSHDLAIGVAVFQRADATDNFHRIDLVEFIVYVVGRLNSSGGV